MSHYHATRLALKKIAPLSYRIRSKTKTSCDSIARLPALCAGDVFAWSVDWFTGLSTSIVIGQSDYFGFYFTSGVDCRISATRSLRA